MKPIFGLPIGIGSLPHKDPAEAVALITSTFPNSPYLPELPQRSFKEAMGYIQTEGFPGLTVNRSQDGFYLATETVTPEAYQPIYEDYLSAKYKPYAVSSEFAAGWQGMFSYLSTKTPPVLLKGQLAGPLTYSHILKDEKGRAIYHNEFVFDVLKKFLILRANWLSEELKKYSQYSLIFLDEPLLQSIGSSVLPVERAAAVSLLKEILREIKGFTGVHCCGNTDWSILIEAGFKVIAFDAFNFTKTLALYPEALNRFLENGGILAWGIVPSSNKIKELTVKDLVQLFQEAQTTLVKNGVSRQLLQTNYLISPSCGLGSLSIETAEEIMTKTASLASSLRRLPE